MTTNPGQPDDPNRTPPPPPPGAGQGVPPQHGSGDAGQAGTGQPQGAPYGGQTYGGPAPTGAPYGGPQPGGAPYGNAQPGGAPYGQGGYGGPAAAYGAPQQPLRDSDQRTWATLAHVGGIFLELIAPLIVWLIFKDRGRFVDEQAKEALNFRITVAIGYFVGIVLTAIGIGAIIISGVWLLALVFSIMAAVATNKGQPYRYPLTLRVIS